jgi:hypothetical protein
MLTLANMMENGLLKAAVYKPCFADGWRILKWKEEQLVK